MFAGAPLIHNIFSMQRLYVFAMCSLVGALSALSVVPAHAQLAPSVVFSELSWGGSGRGIADEWFELANVGATPAAIGGFTVTGMATGGGLITLPDNAEIPPGGTYLIANYAPGDASTLTVHADLVTTTVSIPNTKITATLVASDGTVVDSITDPGTPDFGSSTAPFVSMERDLATLAWQAPTISLNLNDTTQLGTPGFANVPALPANDATVEPPQIIDTVTPDVSAPTAIPENDVVETPIVVDVIAEEPVVIDVGDESIADAVPATEPIADTATAGTIVTEEIYALPEPEAASLLPEEGLEVVGVEPVTPEPTFIIDDTLDPTIETAHADVPEVVTAPEPVTAPQVVEATVGETSPSTTPTEVVTPVVDPAKNSVQGESVDVGGEATTEAVLDETGVLLLNEIFVQTNEWIEVRNADTHDITTTGWSVRDASGKATLLGGYVLAPNALLVVDAPKGKLNNDRDVVELLDTKGAVVDRVEYGTDTIRAPHADESLTRTTDGWFVLSTITKGMTNAEFATTSTHDATVPADTVSATATETLSTNETAETTASAPPTYVAADTTPAPTVTPAASATPQSTTAATTSSTQTPKAATVKKTSVNAASTKTATKKSTGTKKKTVSTVTSIDGLADGALVRYTGTVLALPGTFGSQILMIDGAAVYFYHADWPALAVGDVVTVQGEMSTAHGERRIKIASADMLTLGDHVTPTANDTQTLDTTNNARLVRVTGIIGSREGDTLILTVGDATIRVVASEKSGVHWSALTGSRVTITGIVRHIDGEYVLMPRSMDDVVVQHDEVITSAAQSSSNFPTGEVVGGSMLASIAGILAYWFVRSRTLIPSV